MGSNETIHGRFQQAPYTAAQLTQTNPVLLDGEVVYEGDTGKYKIGNGINNWKELPYAGQTARRWFNIFNYLHGNDWVLGHSLDVPYTVIENVTSADLAELANTDKFRFVLMRWRRKGSNGPTWRIPMLPHEHAKKTGISVVSGMPESITWWPITSNDVKWFRGQNSFSEVFSMDAANSGNQHGPRFKNTRSKLMRVGVAIFEKTDNGGLGWTRVSNIAQVEIFINQTIKVVP